MHARNFIRWFQYGAALVALPLLVGCACCNNLPRIDPTGESCFIWPNQQPSIANPFQPAPAAIPAVPGNIAAPPVYSDTGLPGTMPPASAFPAVASAAGVPAAAVSSPNVVGATSSVVSGEPQYTLLLNPNRVLAPVGSEVVLRAGVCAPSGYYIVNQRVEWMIDRAGPGQIVTVGERGQLDMFRLPHNTPRKVDNWYAIGATVPYHVCLHRGTDTTADDLQIRPGEAWVSVSSATEGTSYVTAYSPAVGNWPGRTARATIIWLDAQWAFPPSVTIPAGQQHVLTTTVTRQSDGAPVAGYLVRYEVAGDGASLGYDAGQVSEIATDSLGRARVEISPTDAAPGSATVNIQIIRPEQPGAVAGPRVVLGSGSTTITWAGGAVSPIPQPPVGQVPPPISRPPEPQPFIPPSTEPAVPPLGTTAPGQPQLEVTVARETPDPLEIEDNVRFLVTVRNRGTAPARNIVVTSAFDDGLSHLSARQGEFRVEYKEMRDLGPGESASVPLTFTITKGGRQCQRVTVTADGATEAFEQGCVDVAAEPAAERPTLRVEMTGERIKNVNDFTNFNTVVENIGSVPATNLVVEIRTDREFLQVTDADRDLTQQPDGTLRVQIPQLAVGARRNFEIRCRCLAAGTSACAHINVTGDNDVRYLAEHCLEIRPPLGAPAPDGAAAGPSNLRIALIETANNAKVGEPAQLFVYIDNTGATSERQVSAAVLIPPNFTVDQTAIQPRGSFQVVNRPEGLELQFNEIAELRAGEQQRYMIPLTPGRAGVSTIMAQVRSQATPEPITQQREISILER